MDLVTRTIIIMVVTLVSGGLGVYGYSFKRKEFASFPIITLYTVMIITIFCIFYIRDIVNDITTHNFDINNVAKLYSYMNIAAAIVAYLTHFFLAKRQIIFLNNAKERLYEVILYLDDGQMYRDHVIKVAIKALLFPFLLEATLVARALHFEPDRNILWTIYSLIPYIVRTAPATSVYGTMLLSTSFIESLNLRIQAITEEINRMHTHKEWLLKTPYHRMQRYCDLSDEIDRLNEKYMIIIDVSNELLDFDALPWLSSMLCNVVGIMSGFFTQYMSIANTLFNDKEYDIYNVITDSAFMLISFMEIYTQAEVCTNAVENVRQTGVVLQNVNSIQADARFREAMDFFSYRILHRNYQIKPLGLFEMDLSVIHGVFSTATGFLLILIQSDLSRRFLQ